MGISPQHLELFEMAMSFYYQGGLQKPVCQKLISTSKTLIGDAAPNNALTLAGFTIANAAAAAKIVSVYWFDGTDEYLIWRKSIDQDDTAVVTDISIRLRKAEEIRIQGDADVHVMLIYSFSAGFSPA